MAYFCGDAETRTCLPGERFLPSGPNIFHMTHVEIALVSEKAIKFFGVVGRGTFKIFPWGGRSLAFHSSTRNEIFLLRGF